MKPRYIAHTGGKQPVSDLTIVEVVFHDTQTRKNLAAWAWDWSNMCREIDERIIAYRVIEQE